MSESGEAADMEQASEEHARQYPTRAYFFSQADNRCGGCGRSQGLERKLYPHADGYRTAENPGRDWLYLHCLSCGYDTAIWKLGVEKPR